MSDIGLFSRARSHYATGLCDKSFLLPKQVAASSRLFGARAVISVEGECKKFLVRLMTLLDNEDYYINCSGIAGGSKSRKIVSHMCG